MALYTSCKQSTLQLVMVRDICFSRVMLLMNVLQLAFTTSPVSMHCYCTTSQYRLNIMSDWQVLISVDDGNSSMITVFSQPYVLSSEADCQYHGSDTLNVTRLSSILISRFMMNLQEVKRFKTWPTSASRSVSLVRFDRVVGSIGETLESSIIEDTEDDGDLTLGRERTG